MPVQAWLIFDAQQRLDAMTVNDQDAALDPREIDNPLADNLGEGVLLGKFVAPARLLSDPPYERWRESLSNLPIRNLDSDSLFLPPPQD